MTVSVTPSHPVRFQREVWVAESDKQPGHWEVVEEGTIAGNEAFSRGSGPGESIKVWTDAAPTK